MNSYLVINLRLWIKWIHLIKLQQRKLGSIRNRILNILVIFKHIELLIQHSQNKSSS